MHGERTNQRVLAAVAGELEKQMAAAGRGGKDCDAREVNGQVARFRSHRFERSLHRE